MSSLTRLVAIVGPTASGKSSLAFRLAQRFQGEILSADSMQVYRKMDIGTAKPSGEERKLVPHHLIDILEPDQEYSAALFRGQADSIILSLQERRVPIFVAGGTGLYLKALTRGLFRGPGADPELRRRLKERAEREGSKTLHRELALLDPDAASRVHPGDLLRIIRALEVQAQARKPISDFHRDHAFQERPYAVLKIGLFPQREKLYRRVEERVDQMIAGGWIEEVRMLLNAGYSRNLKSMSSLGYRHLAGFLQGETDLPETMAAIKRDTRRYAKRQMTWFRSDKEIHWVDPHGQNESGLEMLVKNFLEGAPSKT